MRTPSIATFFFLSSLLSSPLLGLTACDGGAEEAQSTPQKRPKLSELQQAGSDMSPEELAEARKKAGFKSQDEIAAENAALFEKGAREYVKTRLSEYRSFAADFRKIIDQLEKKAPEWKSDAAFEKFEKGYAPEVKAFTARYDTLTGRGVEGGQTQVILGKLFRAWEDLNTGLGVDVGDNPKFAETLAALRGELDALDKALDDIGADESLSVDPEYSPPKPPKK